MSKGLCNMSEYDRKRAIQRRIDMPEGNRGLGYWSAFDAIKQMAKEEKEKEEGSANSS